MNSSHSRSPEFIYIHCVLLFDLAPAKTWTKPRLKLSQPSTFLPPPPVSSDLWRGLSAGCQGGDNGHCCQGLSLVFLSRDAPGPFSLSTVHCPPMSRGFPCNSECAEQLPHYLWLLTRYCAQCGEERRGSWSQLKSRVTSVCGALLQSSDIWTLITFSVTQAHKTRATPTSTHPISCCPPGCLAEQLKANAYDTFKWISPQVTQGHLLHVNPWQCDTYLVLSQISCATVMRV